MNFAVTRVRLAEIFFGIGLAVFIGSAVWITREVLNSPETPIPPQTEIHATLLQEPIIVPDFDLVDQNGNPFTRANLVGQWSILFFGYTHCPDICPTTMTTLVQMEEQLRQYSGLDKPKYVFISVDPERDTPQHLAQYTTYFHQDFLGVTGSGVDLRVMTAPLGIFYQIDQMDSDGNYMVKHSSAILLINPEGELRALMSPPHDAAALASDYRHILGH